MPDITRRATRPSEADTWTPRKMDRWELAISEAVACIEARNSMTSKSLWMSIAVAPQAIPLQGDERCDVVVVGSGIAGLSTAYELSQRGRSVIIIDRGSIAGGMTARTSAHLAPLCDDLMSEMRKIKGEALSRLFYESQAAAVDRIEEIQKSEGIDCDFRRLDGYLF